MPSCWPKRDERKNKNRENAITYNLWLRSKYIFKYNIYKYLRIIIINMCYVLLSIKYHQWLKCNNITVFLKLLGECK